MAAETHLDPGLRAGILVALLVFAAFVVIVVTTVDDRGEIGPDFQASFREKAHRTYPVDGPRSLGLSCDELNSRLYDCVVEITNRRGTRLGVYHVTLRDSGCWSAQLDSSLNSPPLLRRLRACIGGR
ncbi:MAG: hypothetical protein QOI10_1007 [Solirubrobacterales bacterium]|jgi:hypothetical protein|nr:hypothetical protein [Solirubrobacterales bacterium]